MNSKKILGIPVLLFVIGLVVLGGASAVLVNYLSNTAKANVEVKSPMEIAFATINTDAISADRPARLKDLTGTWNENIVLTGTTGLSTSLLGVQVTNKADTYIEGKILRVTVTNDKGATTCGDITNLLFLDTATDIQVAKGYQELSGTCTTVGTSAVYNVPIQSLAPGKTYEYPAKITFGNVAPATYSFSAEMMLE